MLIECAWPAIRKKDSYLRAKYYTLVRRMGKKKAIVVIAHKMLLACYSILYHKVPYRDLGGTFLEEKNKDKLIKHYKKKLSRLGYEVQPAASTAIA